MTFAALILASALLKGDIPAEERVEKLTPFFSPKPGEELGFDATEMRDLGKKTPPEKLRGQVVVSPPPGTCFTIERDSRDSDDVICKKTTLSFSFSQLDRNGFLSWKVSTGEGDFGTRLRWRTPYRVAVVTPFDKNLEDPPQYRYIRHCDGLNDPAKGRRIVLTMVDGETWIVRFPAKDQLLAQPDPIPNLFMTQTQGRISVKEAAEANRQKEAEAASKDHGKPEAEGHGAEATPVKAEEKDKAPSQDDDRALWSIPLRGSYTMPASNFQPYGSVAPGMNGECRYNFQGPDEDPNAGRIECHDVDGFKQVYIPATCLGQIRTSR